MIDFKNKVFSDYSRILLLIFNFVYQLDTKFTNKFNMSDENENKAIKIGATVGSYSNRTETVNFDLLQPWKVISQNNVYIIYLSIFLFAFYSFARHGFN